MKGEIFGATPLAVDIIVGNFVELSQEEIKKMLASALAKKIVALDDLKFEKIYVEEFQAYRYGLVALIKGVRKNEQFI